MATCAAAVVPPAPARLLMTTDCPSASESLAPINLATKSAAPPGGGVSANAALTAPQVTALKDGLQQFVADWQKTGQKIV